MTVFEKIEAQQKGKEGTPAWMVGEQLKEICAGDPGRHGSSTGLRCGNGRKRWNGEGGRDENSS